MPRAGGVLLALAAGALLGLSPVTLADAQASFDEAKVLYEQGQYEEAARAFDRLYTNGLSSVALHYNLGNAWLKAGQPGRAIAHYRVAEHLTPRDADVRANLRIARLVVAGGQSPPHQPFLRRWFGHLSLNEWTLGTTFTFWAWLTVLVIGLLRPELGPRLLRPRQAALGLTVLLGVGLFLAWASRPAMEAVVLDADSPLHHGPREETEVVQALKAGQELVVVDRLGSWARVEGAPRGIGWMQTRHLFLLPR
ncbi:MAG: tetratricopeptide repeat protein [Verrucomicrobiae bacterium]|nr:tetratricopeptide repeat protein [Verrucomicrobiae bacterium]